MAGTADNGMLYIWICLYSFYFFSLPHALGPARTSRHCLRRPPRHDPGRRRGAQPLDCDHVRLVSGRADRRATANRRRQPLRRGADRAAYVDTLNGALNRRGLEERAALEPARARREGTQVSMLAVDIDHFKSLNDGYGHNGTGDDVLFLVAAITRVTRAVDAVARLGGDDLRGHPSRSQRR